jgi:hypothetical protein
LSAQPHGNETPQRSALWLLLIVAAGLALRLPQLNYSFYGDEGFSVLRDSSSLITPTEDRFRPVFFALLYLWRQLGWSGEVGLRLLPLLFGLAQIPLAYIVGKKLRNRTLGLVFAALVAGSPMLIEFSQELRMYSLVGCLALLQTISYLRVLEKPVRERWAVFILIATLGVYTHLHYWAFLAGFAFAFVRRRKTVSWYKGWAALFTVVLLYLPNLSNLMIFAEKRGGDYTAHLPSALPKLFAAVTVGFSYFELPDIPIGRPVGIQEVVYNWPLSLLVLIPAVILLWSLGKLHVKNFAARELRLCHELFTFPVIIAWLATFITQQYWLQPKYIIFVTPFALLFIAQAWLALEKLRLRIFSGVLVLIVWGIALGHYWDATDYGRRENWRGAAEILRTKLNKDSTLLILSGGYSLLPYYWPDVKEQWQVIYVPRITDPTQEYLTGLKNRLNGKQTIYYLWHDVPQNAVDPRNVLLHSLDYIGLRKSVTKFNPRFRLYEWTFAP